MTAPRALAIRESELEPEHSDIAQSLNSLGELRQDQGNLNGAKSDFGRALRIFRNGLGEAHPSTHAVQRHLDALGAG